ncbi:hypothetical protein [Pseudophaeobacter leonis]|uniref:hypothetical protein n=1 Tax=Pseudophaeobacter leonis TaxID=1144477 RepID=UPI00111C45EA|nr:hypothetical protein [Pseudophaeobacter leonis]
MAKPVLRILEGPSPTKEGISQAATAGLAGVLSAGSKAADLFPHDLEGLLGILHFRNETAKAARRRSSWFGGKLYNKFSGDEPDYIPVSGTHLRQALSTVGIETPDFIVASGKYQLRLDISEEAVSILSEKRR